MQGIAENHPTILWPETWLPQWAQEGVIAYRAAIGEGGV